MFSFEGSSQNVNGSVAVPRNDHPARNKVRVNLG